MRPIFVVGLIIVCTIGFIPPLHAQMDHGAHHQHADIGEIDLSVFGDNLGTVQFPNSCKEEVKKLLDRGLALMHNMTYEAARKAFSAATDKDPDCAMGYWGQAMTYIHPLWADPPGEEEFKAGHSLVHLAKSRGQKTERELAYIEAVEAYYALGRSSNERENLAAFAKGWQKASEQFPDDPEIACFNALMLIATADPADKTYAQQQIAGEIAEKVYAQIPDHPGAHHYIIHAYDYPPLAERALDVARNYGTIVPDVPHALHMPSHIFTRLGLWRESIEMNIRSANAALKHMHTLFDYLHAVDYLVYAYLQRSDDEKVRLIMMALDLIKGPYETAKIADAYTLAAVPARYALERKRWADAASIDPESRPDYPWDRFPAIKAIIHYARALGAARSDNIEIARESIERLKELHAVVQPVSPYWANQIEIQRLSATAWLKFGTGNRDEALELMRKAADLESLTEKHPVTPEEVLPARELLADMLMELQRYDEALVEYEMTLKRSPNRFNSLHGAGLAAELSKDIEKAVSYFTLLLEVTENADTEREALRYAKNFIENNELTLRR